MTRAGWAVALALLVGLFLLPGEGEPLSNSSAPAPARTAVSW